MRESHPPFPPQNNKTVMLESHPKFNWPAWDLTIILMMIMIIIIINNNIIQLILEVPRQTISVNIFWETLIGVIADVSDGWCTPTRWKNRNLSNHFGQIRMQSSRCIKKKEISGYLRSCWHFGKTWRPKMCRSYAMRYTTKRLTCVYCKNTLKKTLGENCKDREIEFLR